MLLIKPNLEITEKDIENGKQSLEEFLIKPLTPKNAEKGLIYAILTRGNLSTRSQQVMKRLEEGDLTSLKAWTELIEKHAKTYLKILLYHNRIYTCLMSTYSYLEKNNNWFEQIKTDPYGLRENMVKNIKFIGPKISSLWLRNCGQDFVAVDINILRFICHLGFEYNKTTPEGKIDVVHFNEKDYKRAEEFVKDIVNNNPRFHNTEYSPLALFDATVWNKYALIEKKS